MRPLLGATVIAALMVTGAAGGETRAGANVDAILAAHRAAVNDPPAGSALTAVYRQVSSGLTGTLTEQIDLTTGAYVQRSEADGVKEAEGFDGSTPWQEDVSGTYTPQQGGDRIPSAVSAAYRHANLWWRADRGGAAIDYVGRERDGSRTLEHLSVTPRGGRRFEAWFDSQTHLLARVSYDQQFLHLTETYADYRREGPQVLAHEVVVDPGLGAGAVSRATLMHCDYAAAPPAGAYAMPNPPLTGAVIAGNLASTTVPFRLLNNHVYVEATVEGKGPYTFIVDTGGHTLLSPRLVRDVGLKPIGTAVTSGAGEGHGTSGFVHYDEIAIGGVRLHDQMGFATDIYDKSIEGIAVDGMVGFELLRRLVTTIDYGRRTITFTTPARFRPGPDQGVAIPFVFYDHVPSVPGRIGDLPARLDIDTGSRTELDVTSPFVARHGLRERFTRGTNAITGWGVGGPARSYVVRMPAVAIGPQTVADAVVGLSDARGGTFSDPNFDGNVGSALLKRFVVTFDYTRQVLYLKPIEPVPADVGTFDRSGLWVIARGGGYQVMDVAPGSAAAQAGLKVGDLIVAVDGRPVVEARLSQLRETLRSSAPGTRVGLTVRREKQSRGVTLLLRDQI
ncbi:MAG: aspartyl protease family protein [Proteobacteria bacterium]|nr:aspartyl protease family protein [Pseudomonadota bacterium]